MKKNAKRILIVQPLYSIVIYFIISICGIMMLFLPVILRWKMETLFIRIIYYVIAVMFFVLGLLCALRFMEYAIVDDCGIVIKNPFGKIISLKFNVIESIKIKNLLTYSSRGYISVKWIIIRKDRSSIKEKILNKKRNEFCQIKASKRNISILKLYAERYHIPFEQSFNSIK